MPRNPAHTVRDGSASPELKCAVARRGHDLSPDFQCPTFESTRNTACPFRDRSCNVQTCPSLRTSSKARWQDKPRALLVEAQGKPGFIRCQRDGQGCDGNDRSFLAQPFKQGFVRKQNNRRGGRIGQNCDCKDDGQPPGDEQANRANRRSNSHGCVQAGQTRFEVRAKHRRAERHRAAQDDGILHGLAARDCISPEDGKRRC